MKRRVWVHVLVLCALLLPAWPGAAVQAHSPVLYAKPGGLESGFCTSWAQACSLQYALDQAASDQQIWVAAGIHTPGTAYTFQLKSGVAVYGGFPEAGGTWDERDWLDHETHLSGDLGTPGDIGDNSLHVVTAVGVDATAILDGFWIEDGNATYTGTPPDDSHNYNAGGGVYIQDASPALRHLKIAHSQAFLSGGGMYNAGTGHPALEDVTFSGNEALDGGAIFNAGSLDLINVAISSNSAIGRGGGIFNGLTAVLSGSRVTLEGNTATNGGGLHNEDGEVELAVCTFSGNTADTGGGLANVSGSVQVLSSLFTGNGALGGGGLNSSGLGSTTLIYGTTFDRNDAMEGGAIRNDGSGHMDIVNSTISGNRASGSAAGIITTSWDGTDLYNVTITGNVLTSPTGGGAGGLFNEDGTFSLHNSIIAGNVTHSTVEQYPDCLTAEVSLPWPVPFVEHTLIGDGTGCNGRFDAGSGNLIGVSGAPLDPGLYRLAGNGGSTPTHALRYDSPALEAGDPNGCKDQGGNPLPTDQRGIARARDGDADGTAVCDMGAFEAGLDNDAWTRALHLDLAGDPLQATAGEYIDKLGQSRWYKFTVEPGSRVSVQLTGLPANYDLILYKDIAAAYDSLLSREDLVRLDAEFAPDMFSPDMFSPDMFSPDMFSPDMFSPDMFSPDMFSPDMFSPDMFSPDMFSPDMFSPDMFSPDMFSPDMFSPDALAFASAQVRSMVAVSAFDGTAAEAVEANTWDNSGDFYVRVRGRNGAFDLSAPFHLHVTQEVGLCAGVTADLEGDRLPAVSNDYETIILTDWSRISRGDLEAALDTFASRVEGVVVDVSQDPYIANANAQADANRGCPYAKNIVARAIKEIVQDYATENPIQYVVLVGNDDVIPFFRYPDRALLANERNYIPPVKRNTASHASLALGYVLSQDAYGSAVDLSLSNTTLPVPKLPVGRLVETPAEILTLLGAYEAEDGGVIHVDSALVTGYDFLADVAASVHEELAGGPDPVVAVDSLITPSEVAPLDRDGTPPEEAPWPADLLGTWLDGSDYDLIFLAGHFSAGSALAADYETRLLASKLLDSSADLTNALVYSAGCHSGYNIVNEHGIPLWTPDPDWAQAFAAKGATFVGGTGYQYGDTDFIEYSERLYLEFTRQLRCGLPSSGGSDISVGEALVAAKQAYLAGTAQMRGIHEKSVLEATLYGLPMIRVTWPNTVDCPGDPPATLAAVPYATPPGSILGLYHAAVTVNSSLTPQTVSLSDAEGNTLTATYLEGADGVVVNPAEPVLPLERQSVNVNVPEAPDLALRGIGFRSATYVDAEGVAPLTGAATTEIRGVHTPFQSEVFYPIRPWRANYFDALANPASGTTWLDVTPAQFKSDWTDVTDPWHGTLRRFDDMEFRLFYSSNTATYGGNVPALAAPPAIVKVMAAKESGGIAFRVTVLGDPAAGIQEVWVTYTGASCGAGATCTWQSLDLSQDEEESTLWTGTLSGVPAGDLRFMVQAVNGLGLVTLATNQGEYYQAGIDPADPSAGGDPASPPAPTTLSAITLPGSAEYGTEVDLSVQLTSGDSALGNQRVKFALGALQRWATTGVDGVATAYMPLLAAPGAYDLRVTFPGTAEYLRSSTTSGFAITQQPTLLSLDPAAATAQYSDDSGLVASLTDGAGRPLREKTVLFVLENGTNSYGTAAITNLVSEAALGPVPWPQGDYAVAAHFGEEVTLPGGTVDMRDPYYTGSRATGSLHMDPENATVTYTGDTAPVGSIVNLSALVEQEDDGAPGDITLAQVQYEILDAVTGLLVDTIVDGVNSDGLSEAPPIWLNPGSYELQITVIGGYFASPVAYTASINVTNVSPIVGTIAGPTSPVAVGTPVMLSADFESDSGDTHTATWDWDDGTTSPGSVDEAEGLVSGSHTYTTAGVYMVRLTLTDSHGASAEAIFEYVVVYDPNSGFVTGGGWIWSEAGWCQLDDQCASAAGKANFGFVSKYKKGANVPTGATVFQFHAGALNFHSASYEWLVVAKAKAMFKGVGTINDQGNYGFLLSAIDAELTPSTDVDLFRIKIWDRDRDDFVVYDNQIGEEEDADPTTAIGGGSIVIHSGK